MPGRLGVAPASVLHHPEPLQQAEKLGGLDGCGQPPELQPAGRLLVEEGFHVLLPEVAGQLAHGDRLPGRVQQRQQVHQGLGQAAREGRLDQVGEWQRRVQLGQDGGGPVAQLQGIVQKAPVLLDRHEMPLVDAGQAQLLGPADQNLQAGDVLRAPHAQAARPVGIHQTEQAGQLLPVGQREVAGRGEPAPLAQPFHQGPQPSDGRGGGRRGLELREWGKLDGGELGRVELGERASSQSSSSSTSGYWGGAWPWLATTRG